MAGYKPQEAKPENIEQKIRAEVVGKITAGLMKLADGNGDGFFDLTMHAPAATASAAEATASAATAVKTGDSYMAPWIESENCSACDECIKINPAIFAYNKDKKACIINPEGGPYPDLVKAAERCTAGVIHPGLPRDRSVKDIDRWIKRGEKFN